MTEAAETLAIGIWQLRCRARGGDIYADALLKEMMRLYYTLNDMSGLVEVCIWDRDCPDSQNTTSNYPGDPPA